MNLSAHGDNISAVEVTHISSHGVWLLAHGREFFMAYIDYPWFKDQPVKAILNVEEPTKGHYYWPDIDVDLSQEILENPDKFKNIAKL